MAERAARERLIGGSPLFAELGSEARSALDRLLVTRSLPAGATLYRRGDAPDGLWGVLAGKVRFGAASLEGRGMLVNDAGPGDWFGEIGLLDGGPRLVDAEIAESAELLLLRQRDVLDFCRREPSVPMALARLLSARLRLAAGLMEEQAFLPLERRLARRLLAAARGDRVPLTQEQLGRLAGATREAVGRHLSAWTRAGWVTPGYRCVSILDRRALEALAEG
ncbi:MAG TPA: Crp/Fnr family transcriptional regulator [Azospirillaceae bacterium]|nr:Crp/Fnr family transcriptional regulator [Azospirillaceae bacterium]